VGLFRRRSLLALTLREREEISRGIVSGSSIRVIAKGLDRAVSTVSREVARHGGRSVYRANQADSEAWESALRPKQCLKVWSAGLVQRYDFAVYHGVSGEITKRLDDLRESFVEVLVVPRIQDGFAGRSDFDSAVAVQLDLIAPVRAFGEF
jgi:Helix-turn-helix domain